MPEPQIKKSHYLLYKKALLKAKIQSFIDQFGKTYTACPECDKKDCKTRSVGCMKGTPKEEILIRIKRKGF